VADATFYGSIFPAIWTFQLALRTRRLGSSITTMHLPFHQFVADELGIPRQVTQIGLLPVAHTTGTGFGPADRVPASSVTFWDDWGRPRADASLREGFISAIRKDPTLPATRAQSSERQP
jgi:hypothetical protein